MDHLRRDRRGDPGPARLDGCGYPAVTYDIARREVSDIAMVAPFGDDRNRAGVEWPEDGGLYLPGDVGLP